MCKTEIESTYCLALRRDRLRQPRVRRAAGRGADVPGVRPNKDQRAQDRLSSSFSRCRRTARSREPAEAEEDQERRSEREHVDGDDPDPAKGDDEPVERAVAVVDGGRRGAGRHLHRDRGVARGMDRARPAAAELGDLRGERGYVLLGVGRLRLALPVGEPRLEPVDLAGGRVDLGLDVLDRDVLADDRPERREPRDGALDVLLRDAQDDRRVARAALRVDVERLRVAAERAGDRDRLLRVVGDRLRCSGREARARR